MRNISCYDLLSLLPAEALSQYAHQNILKEMQSDEYDATKHREAQFQVLAAFSEIGSEYAVPEYLREAWDNFTDFFAALKIDGPETENQRRYLHTFCNYIEFASEAHELCLKINRKTPHIVELGPGYGFSSYILEKIYRHKVLCLAPHGDVSQYSWLMDKFMYNILPVTHKDIFTLGTGSLASFAVKFNGFDMVCASGLPFFLYHESDLMKDIGMTAAKLLFLLEPIAPGGVLFLKNQNFFAYDLPSIERKRRLYQLALHMKTLGHECLAVHINDMGATLFPDEWKGYNQTIALQKGSSR